jgi:hypothetical protein
MVQRGSTHGIDKEIDLDSGVLGSLSVNDSSLYKSMGIVGMGIKSTSLEPYRLLS